MTFDWLNITPTSGIAGETTLAISVNSENKGEDRQKTFKVTDPDGTTHKMLTVVQKKGEKGVRAYSSAYGAGYK